MTPTEIIEYHIKVETNYKNYLYKRYTKEEGKYLHREVDYALSKLKQILKEIKEQKNEN